MGMGLFFHRQATTLTGWLPTGALGSMAHRDTFVQGPGSPDRIDHALPPPAPLTQAAVQPSLGSGPGPHCPGSPARTRLVGTGWIICSGLVCPPLLRDLSAQAEPQTAPVHALGIRLSRHFPLLRASCCHFWTLIQLVGVLAGRAGGCGAGQCQDPTGSWHFQERPQTFPQRHGALGATSETSARIRLNTRRLGPGRHQAHCRCRPHFLARRGGRPSGTGAEQPRH